MSSFVGLDPVGTVGTVAWGLWLVYLAHVTSTLVMVQVTSNGTKFGLDMRHNGSFFLIRLFLNS